MRRDEMMLNINIYSFYDMMLKQMIRFFELTPFVQVPQWSESSEPDRWHWPESAAAITWPPDCSSSESSTSMTGGLRHGAFAVTSFTHLSRFSACWRRLRFKGHQPKIRGMQEDIQTSTNANHPRSNHARTKSLIHIPWVIHITIHIPWSLRTAPAPGEKVSDLSQWLPIWANLGKKEAYERVRV